VENRVLGPVAREQAGAARTGPATDPGAARIRVELTAWGEPRRLARQAPRRVVVRPGVGGCVTCGCVGHSRCTSLVPKMPYGRISSTMIMTRYGATFSKLGPSHGA